MRKINLENKLTLPSKDHIFKIYFSTDLSLYILYVINYHSKHKG